MSEPRLYIALYADEDARRVVIQHLIQQGYDVQYALDTKINHEGWDDERHLIYAAAHGRAILSHNIRDFKELFDKWWEAERPHAGIIVVPQLETGVLIQRLLKLLNTVTADEMVNNYKHLGEFE